MRLNILQIKGVYKVDWISVKDKLPQHESFVLCCTVEHLPRTALFHSQGDYLFLNPDNMRFQYRGITHWMPLPELPKDNE